MAVSSKYEMGVSRYETPGPAAGPKYEAAGRKYEVVGPKYEVGGPKYDAAGPKYEAAGVSTRRPVLLQAHFNSTYFSPTFAFLKPYINSTSALRTSALLQSTCSRGAPVPPVMAADGRSRVREAACPKYESVGPMQVFIRTFHTRFLTTQKPM